jgi:nicotinate phosphoribosyltransferase
MNDRYAHLALLTDLYQLTMAQGYFLLNMAQKKACFHLFFRKRPFDGEYAIASGLEPFLEFFEQFRYAKEDVEYLSSIKAQDGSFLFKHSFLEYLKNLRFTCDILAAPEGSVVFPYEPFVQVTGPLLQCQLLETPLLNFFNFSTLISTKAARIASAAQGDTLVEFGLRRAQGMDGALTASRAAYIGGADSTSNVMAGKLFNIPVSGTQAHSWIMAHPSEIEAFENFAKVSPNNCSFLIDTYNSLEGAKKAIAITKKLEDQGVKVLALRLDSGDLVKLSQTIRAMLDEHQLKHIKLMATNELDEFVILELKNKGAKIDIWGVGTHLVTAKNQPSLDGVYKLSGIENPEGVWERKLKISDSPSKTTDPGILQVKRYSDALGYKADVLVDENLAKEGVFACYAREGGQEINIDPSWQVKDLLVQVIKQGHRVFAQESLQTIRQRKDKELTSLPKKNLKLAQSSCYPVYLEKNLFSYKQELIAKMYLNP